MPKKHKKFISASIKSKKDLNERFPLLKIIYLSIAINLLVMIAIVLLNNRLPPEVPIFYGLPEGPSQLGPKNHLAIPSILAMLFIVINLLMVFFIKNDFLKKTLIITGFILSVFSFTTTLKIMFLVGNF